MTEIETQDLVDNVNKQLSKLGWIINPFNTTAKQMDELTEILKHPLEEKIYLTLNDSVVAFSYRSHSVVRALQLQSVKDYSHLYENGILL
jgi:ligand-binding sensor domain-containing protein